MYTHKAPQRPSTTTPKHHSGQVPQRPSTTTLKHHSGQAAQWRGTISATSPRKQNPQMLNKHLFATMQPERCYV